MKKNLLITGGCGFIGSNLARHFLEKGYAVTIFDNFSRVGAAANVSWLKNSNPSIKIIKGDIRNIKEVKKAVKRQDIIFHLAGQVAVTSSVSDPRSDFDINALGTFNVLEAARTSRRKPIFIFASTNKVYGRMEAIKIVEKETRYSYQDLKFGVPESMPLDFHSPYGCSKGAGDQYVRDYYRIYDLPTVVFRQSCIYGPRQFGVEDQGWVAWFIIAETNNAPITIYGDGKQVRDILYIDDLVRLFELTLDNIDKARGKIYNIGGGIDNTLSVWYEFGPILNKLFGKKIKVKYSSWRLGDQKVYISDIRKVEKELGWRPKVGVREGIEKLYQWVRRNKELFKK